MSRLGQAMIVALIVFCAAGSSEASPIAPSPPSPPPPSALPDAIESRLSVTTHSTHADVDKWLAYYKSVGYAITVSRAEYFSNGKIKEFQCHGAKPIPSGSKTVDIKIDGVRNTISVSNQIQKNYRK